VNHFDEMTALLLLEGQLDAAHVQEVKAHAASCAQCRELLRALEMEGVWLRQAIAEDEESVPARLMEAPARGAAPWGWIATFGFGAGGAYTLWSSIIDPWRAQAAQAGFTQGNLLTLLFFSGAFWKGWNAMRSLMEFLAVATLGMVVMWLLRRHVRRTTTFAVVMSAVLCALALPPSAAAGEVRHGDPNYTLASGQELQSDLIVYANYTRIDGDVDGDLIVWTQTLTVNGHVKGDVIAFAREVRLNGSVDGSLRAFANTLSVEGTVGRNVMAWAGEITVNEKAKVGGTATVGCEDLVLSGQVGNDVMAMGDSMEINGSLGRNLMVDAKRLTIGSTAEIKGWTKYEGHHEAEVASGAKLGTPIKFSLAKEGPDYKSPRYYWHRTLLWGASFLFGLALLLLAPRFFFDATSACNRFGVATGFGILFLIATPIVAILVCCTIVGIGVGIATVLLYVIALYAAQVFVGCWLGEKLLGASHGMASAIGRLALGLAILRGLEMIPHWVGAVVASVVLVCGLGAIVIAIYRNVRPPAPVAAQA
jgi:cytoskeletal protein CcmA (bactofilin family)